MNKISFTQGRLSDINSQSFPKNWSQEIYTANKIGLEKIEWIFDSNYKKNPLLNDKRKIEKILNINSLKISSICLDNYLSEKFSTNKKNYNFLKYLITKTCRYYKIKIIVLPLLKKSQIDIKYIIKNKKWFSNLNKILENNKVYLCLETDLNPSENYYLMKLLNLKFIALTYDTGNSAYWGFDQEIELNLLHRYIKHLHIKDCTPKQYSVEFGKGNVSFKFIFDFFKRKKFNGVYVLQGYKSKNYILDIKKQLKFVKRFI